MEGGDMSVGVQVPRLHSLVSSTGGQQVTRPLKLQADHSTWVRLLHVTAVTGSWQQFQRDGGIA